MLEEAHFLAAHGFAVFPLSGKVPAIAGGRGCLDASLEPDGVEALWAAARRQGASVTGVGVATGEPSGVWVLDIDGEEGEDSLRDLVDELEIPRGGGLDVWSPLQVETGRGRHLYFSAPEDGVWPRNRAGLRAEGKRYPKIDVRSTGGYVVAPPSAHPDGGIYRWVNTGSDAGPCLAPQWLLSVLRGRFGVSRRVEVAVPPAGGVVRGEEGHARRYALRGLERLAAGLLGTEEGERHAALNRAAYRVGGWVGAGLLGTEEASGDLLRAWVATAGEGRYREGERTIRDALAAGAAAPTPVADRRGGGR